MKILEFIASLANSLAWPIVVVVLAVIFKTPVTALLDALHKRIPHLRRATGPGNTSVEFDQVAEQAEAAAAELPQPNPISTEPAGDTTQPRLDEELQRPYFLDPDRTRKLGLNDPAAALLVTYAELEEQVRKFYTEVGLSRRTKYPTGSMNKMSRELVSEGYLPESFLNVLRPVAAARNALAHGQEPDVGDRAEVRDLVQHCADLARFVAEYRVFRMAQPGIDGAPLDAQN